MRWLHIFLSFHPILVQPLTFGRKLWKKIPSRENTQTLFHLHQFTHPLGFATPKSEPAKLWRFYNSWPRLWAKRLMPWSFVSTLTITTTSTTFDIQSHPLAERFASLRELIARLLKNTRRERVELQTCLFWRQGPRARPFPPRQAMFSQTFHQICVGHSRPDKLKGKKPEHQDLSEARKAQVGMSLTAGKYEKHSSLCY